MKWTCLLLVLFAAPLAAQPVRLSVPAFGDKAEVEVRDLRTDQGEAAAREALEEIFSIEQLTRPGGEQPGGLGWLNSKAGQGPAEVDPRLADMLNRALQFCFWSRGIDGPLGGELYRLWREGQVEQRGVDPAARRLAVERASCDRLKVQGGDSPAANLAEGSRLDLWGIAQGYAVDRATDILRRRGAGNVFVRVGKVWRALGPGPDGEGWYLALPPATDGDLKPIDEIWLRDQAVAVRTMDGREEGGRFVPILDQRTGRPGTGVVAVVVASELAVDSSGLATSLFLLGLREGQRRLGSISSHPAAFWLLGDGKGAPIGASHRWSEVHKVR